MDNKSISDGEIKSQESNKKSVPLKRELVSNVKYVQSVKRSQLFISWDLVAVPLLTAPLPGPIDV